MIYMFTALYEEARVFIERYHLKKTTEDAQFQRFSNETAKLRLTVTGVGEISAASAVSSICTKYRPNADDFLLNIGICAGRTGKTGCFLIHKLTEQATGKTFYPDLLYRHPFPEESLVTGMVPWDRQQEGAGCPDDALYDMEAAAVYQSGNRFFGPHQMIFLKIVSDSGEPEKISREQIPSLMRQERIFAFVEWLCAVKKAPVRQETPIEQLCADMHCSKAMGDSLRQHIRYLTLAGVDYEIVLREMYEDKRLPCKDKKEGKLCFEEFKRRLF